MKRLLTGVNRLTQVLNAIGNGITVQDPTGKLVFANTAAAAMMGYDSADDVIAAGGSGILTQFRYFDERGRELNAAALPGRRALQGIPEPEMIIGYHSRSRTEDLRWASLKAEPIFNRYGKVVLAVNVFQDITAQKNIERQLKDANDRVTKLLAQTLETPTRITRK